MTKEDLIDYWVDAVVDAIELAGIEANSDQIATLAESMVHAHSILVIGPELLKTLGKDKELN